MFRMANERKNHIIEAQIHVVFVRWEVTAEGRSIRRFHDLSLVRDRNALFALSWTAIHPIDRHSPLFGMTNELMKKQQAVLVVSLTGLDETLLQTIPARHVYLPEQILFNMSFADIITPALEGSAHVVDSSQFDEVIDETIRADCG